MEIRRIAGALGAELLGVDLSREIPAGEIRKAFLEHQVIFFRDQKLDPAQFMAFARRLGKPIEYPFVKGIEGFPEVIEV
ncbi:MAG TPA: TauD/TfdA family dioxygenase, partial [Burkholderiales bacterium]|nr:TauD/TfdA family dioxygenase [Burkholderiales bacterium]